MKLNLNPLNRSQGSKDNIVSSPKKSSPKKSSPRNEKPKDSTPTTPNSLSKILSPRKMTLKNSQPSSSSLNNTSNLSSSSSNFSFSSSSTSDSIILAKLPTLFQNSSENVIVSFRKTELSDEFWGRFCESLKINSYLLDLDLSFCGLTAKRLRILGEALSINNTLIKLNLEGNSIARKSFREFLETVFSSNFTLQYLDIGSLWDPFASTSTISRSHLSKNNTNNNNSTSTSTASTTTTTTTQTNTYNYDYSNYQFNTVQSPPPPTTHARSSTNAPLPLFGLISPRNTQNSGSSSPSSPLTSSSRFRDLESLISPRKTTFQTPSPSDRPTRDNNNSPRTIRKHLPLRLVRSEAKLDKFCLTDSSELLNSCLQSNQSIQQCKAMESKSLLLSGRFLKTFPSKELNSNTILSKIIQLDISDNGLNSIPKEIFECLTELRILVCDNNSLTSITPDIRSLKKLRSLSVRNNRLVNIDPVVDLIFLSELDVALNELKRLPPKIINLSRLRHLKAFGNPFNENILPKAIVDEGDTNLIYYLRSLAEDE